MKGDTIKRSDAIRVVTYSHLNTLTEEERIMLVNDIPSADRPQEWIPCSERLPEACKEVLLTCEVRPIGFKPFRYVCTAEWIPKFCKEALSIEWDEEATEYCEVDDEYYPNEGWYECIKNWDNYRLVGIADFAIAWQPLQQPWKGADDE